METISISPVPAVTVGLAGGLLLLNALDSASATAFTWVTTLTATSLALFALVVVDRDFWWMAIPAAALLAGAASTGLARIPVLEQPCIDAGMLAALSVGFWVVAATHEHRWWAIVAAGALTTLAIVSIVANTSGPIAAEAAALAGAAVTFSLVAATPGGAQRRWAVLPAIVFASGAVGVAFTEQWLVVTALAWPFIALAVGTAITLRVIRRDRHASRLGAGHQPVASTLSTWSAK